MLKAAIVFLAALGTSLQVTAVRGNKAFSNEPLVNDSLSIDSGEAQPRALLNEDDDVEESNIVCGVPLDIEGAIAPDLEGTEFAVGSTVRYQCNFGYVNRGTGGFLSTCKISELTGKAEWTQLDISCVSRSCGDPGDVVNGRRIGNLFTFPNKIEFECEEGYKLRGLKARYCQANGDWSGRLPICEQNFCSAPPVPANGRVDYFSLEYGAELRYECNKGFVLSNHQPRFCKGDGTWSNKEPECIETRCKVPDQPLRGSLQLSGEPKVGSLALYSCDDDTTMVGASTSKCLKSGDWTFDPPKCLRLCEITDIKDGEIGQYETIRSGGTRRKPTYTQRFVPFQVGEKIKHNETVHLRCKSGFMSNADQVLCSDGSWNKSMRCEPNLCLGDPPPMENGFAVVEDRSHGHVIWYQCEPHFTKEKSGKVTCDHGTWNGYTPVCSDTRCYMDQLNFPGLKEPQQAIFPTGGTFEIACEEGYRMSSSINRATCSNGKWNIQKTPCEIEVCYDDPPPIMNGKSLPFNREHGSVVPYECDENFDMIGMSTVWCEAGKWGGKPPSCQLSEENVAMPSALSIDNVLGVTPELLNKNKIDECFCSYDYDSRLVTATVGNKTIEPDDTVEKGAIVSFRCPHPGTYLLWPNGLRFHGIANVTCAACDRWQQQELPTCDTLVAGDSMIDYNEKMKILQNGIIEITKNDKIEIRCMNFWNQGIWYPGGIKGILYTVDSIETAIKLGVYSTYMEIASISKEQVGRYECYFVNHGKALRPTVLELRVAEPEIRCPELQTNRGRFVINYEDDRKVNTSAHYKCSDNTKRIIGVDRRKCLENGRWSDTFPLCEDITCPRYTSYNGLIVSFTNNNKVNSVATFRCTRQATLEGSNTTICQHNGMWSNLWPKCNTIYIRCPYIDRNGIFSIQYSNERRINSTAQFYCIERNKKVEGCNFVTCQQNGEWSGTYPTCVDYVTCTRFEETQSLKVSYSDGVRVGSIASFRCLPPDTLNGKVYVTCLKNGTWNHPASSCEAPKCSIDTLTSSIPEGVYPDMSKVSEEFVPPSTELQLLCEDNLVPIGSLKATCGSQGRWDHGNIQCVPGCRLKDASSYLLIEPVKDYYRLGDFILLSCPPGLKLTSEVERVMCMGRSWSDDLPDCIEDDQTSPSGSRETTRVFA